MDRNSFPGHFRGRSRGWKATLALLVGLAASPALAQDAQYWTIQYGNRARMLGGAVIGSADDVSAVYYNPGALALNADRELLLAGNVLEYTTVTLVGGLRQDEDLRQSRFAGIPSLFAGELRFGWLGRSRLAYSFLTRLAMDFRIERRGNLLSPEAPEEFAQLAADLRVDQSLNEYWGGLTWSYPIGPGLGAGITAFAASRSHQWSGQTSVQAANEQGAGAIALVGGQHAYSSWRMLARMGLSYGTGPVSLGVTLTTPSASVRGSGRTGLDQSLVTQDLDGDGSSVSQIFTDSQDDLQAEFRSPLSVGLGASFQAGATRLHVAAEWFDAVEEFEVIRSAAVIHPETGETVSTAVTYAARSVTNVALALEQQSGPRTRAFAGFRTDFSTIDPDADTSVAIASWNLYHLSGGATFGLGQSDFTLGAIYAFGNQEIPGFQVTPSEEADELLGVPESIRVEFRRITVVLGFKIRFQ